MSAEPRGLMRGRSALKPRAKYFQRRNMDPPGTGLEIAAMSEVIVPERARAGVDRAAQKDGSVNERTGNFCMAPAAGTLRDAWWCEQRKRTSGFECFLTSSP